MTRRGVILLKNSYGASETPTRSLESSWYKRKLTAEDRKRIDCYKDKKTEKERLRDREKRETEKYSGRERRRERSRDQKLHSLKTETQNTQSSILSIC